MVAQIPNPYAGRGLFVGRQKELEEVQDYLGQGESALLIGGRCAGKTSLAEKICGIGRTIYRYTAPASLLHSETSILRALGRMLGGECKSRTAFTEALRKRAPLAIIIDEADQILAERWAGSFLSYLRYLIDSELRSELTILLIGGPALNRYKNPDDKGSPPLNTARRVYLQPLAPEARKELIAPLRVPPDVPWLNEQAAGHPWLLTRLLEQLWRGATQDDAFDHLFAEALPNFEIWKRQLGDEGCSFLRALPPTGVARTTLLRDQAWSRHRAAAVIARSMCLIDIDGQGRVMPGPAIFTDWLKNTPIAEKWDLAISYASEDCKVATAIAKQLTGDVRVFFDLDQEAYTWGEDLNRLLPHTYGVEARYILVLSSAVYLEKHWTLIEWNAALAGKPGRILLLEMGALPPDLPEGLVYRRSDPAALITLVSDLKKRLGRT